LQLTVLYAGVYFKNQFFCLGSDMRNIYLFMLSLSAFSCTAATLDVTQLPTPIFADREVSGDAALPASRLDRLRVFRLEMTFASTPSNNVQVAFGRDPATPDVEIPVTPPQKKGSDFITNNDAIEEANKAFEAGVLYARNSICKSTDCCCKTVQVKIICKFGFDIGSRLLFGPLGHNLCGKSETVNCGR
jgi:hypothetical protein